MASYLKIDVLETRKRQPEGFITNPSGCLFSCTFRNHSVIIPNVPSDIFSDAVSAVQPVGLTLHILHHDVIDLTQRSEIFQHEPGLIGVVVKL